MLPEHLHRTNQYAGHIARYRFAAPLAAGRRVLDAACGAGYGSKLLIGGGARAVIGIDLDRDLVEYARDHHRDERIRFLVDDVRYLKEVQDRSVDLFVCFETIEHVDEPRALLTSAKRVLADGGVFVCSTPNREASRSPNPHPMHELLLGEFRALLEEFFANVRIHGQRNLLATEIASLDHGSRGLAVHREEAGDGEDVPPYFVAVASDGELSSLEGGVFLGAAADVEKDTQHISRLEEREETMQGIDRALLLKEVVVAQRLVRQAVRLNRLLGMVPSRTLRWIRDLQRWRSNSRLPIVGTAPRYSILVPVFQLGFLEASIESVLGQTFQDYELVLHDDASPDARVRELLERYRSHPRTKVSFGRESLGISRATNRCIGLAHGEYLAFLDCDDQLEPDALACVDRRIAQQRRIDFLYANRVDVNRAGEVVQVGDFRNRAIRDPAEALLEGMFASHFKVVHRDVLHRVGLFREEYDPAQGYDFALRISEKCKVHFIDRAIHRHHLDARQTTPESESRQNEVAERARKSALLRRQLTRGEVGGRVSVVILSLNRLEDTRRCLRSLRERTRTAIEILLVDNGSTPDALAGLRALVAEMPGAQFHEVGRNLGCGGGRNEGVRRTRGEYVVFLDNDIEVTDGWLEHLLFEMESDERTAACCCRVVFPNRRIQFNGGAIHREGRRIRFELTDTGRASDELATLESRTCGWVPGGATIYRRALLESVPYDETIVGLFEDNDWCLRVADLGYRFRNCPLATVIHHHLEFNKAAQADRHYVEQRYNPVTLRATLRNFYRKHGRFIDDDDLYRSLGYRGGDDFAARELEGTPVSGAAATGGGIG